MKTEKEIKKKINNIINDSVAFGVMHRETVSILDYLSWVIDESEDVWRLDYTTKCRKEKRNR